MRSHFFDTRNADNDNDNDNDRDNENEKDNVIDIGLTLHYENEKEKGLLTVQNLFKSALKMFKTMFKSMAVCAKYVQNFILCSKN